MLVFSTNQTIRFIYGAMFRSKHSSVFFRRQHNTTAKNQEKKDGLGDWNACTTRIKTVRQNYLGKRKRTSTMNYFLRTKEKK